MRAGPRGGPRLCSTAAEGWLRERGRDRMVGPMDFTTNDECGLLIEGHERPPIILCPWHHPYYQPLLEQELGLAKAMDLYMWSLQVSDREKVHPAIWQVADKVESEHGIVCRNFRKKDLQAEVGRFLEVYNSAWERNWGFVPLTEEEVRHYAKDLKPVLDENWAMVAERKDTGEVVGAALTLPDYNQVLHKLNGRAAAVRLAHALRERKNINQVRVFALGVKPQYQHTGVAARFYQMHFDAAERTPQTGGEMGWILETNKPMNRAMEGMGGRDRAPLPRLRARAVAAPPAALHFARMADAPRAPPAAGSSTPREIGREPAEVGADRRRIRAPRMRSRSSTRLPVLAEPAPSAPAAVRGCPARTGASRAGRPAGRGGGRHGLRGRRGRGGPGPPPASAPLYQRRAGQGSRHAPLDGAVGELVEIVGTRSLLVDVHLLGGRD